MMTRWWQSIKTHPRRWDAVAVVVLVMLWAGFFWRLLTPLPEDQASLPQGDFSGQFVAFGAYQAERLWAGDVPLWNPYNNGGLPFLADTQSAVFYPPRLITVALAGASGGWSYHALEVEMMAHVLLTSLLMYAFVRRLTRGSSGSVWGGLAAAITWAYGGFMTGYPPLQLALLEAAAWGPLLLLSVHEATDGERPRPGWYGLGGLALGLSALAGHPQTVWFLGYLFLAFLAYRVIVRRWRWTAFVTGAALIGGLGVVLAAVQLLPAAEYLQQVTRIGFGFEAKAGGFPVQDVLQVLLPGVLSVWSPLYIGIVGLTLAVFAVWQRVRDAALWGGVVVVGLLLSFGGNAALYPLLYNVLPGLRLFRGQERAAVVIALAASVLVGLGMARLVAWVDASDSARRGLRRGLLILFGVAAGVMALVLALWLGPARETVGPALSAAVFTLLIAGGGLLLINRLPGSAWAAAGVIALIVFDLFTVGWGGFRLDSVPPSQQLTRSLLIDAALADDAVPPGRVDGQRGVLANYGTLWGLPDIRGISPLWLQGPHAIIQEDRPAPLAWELFAVRYVFSDWAELPVPAEVVAGGEDAYGPVNLHRLADPRPFALLLDDVALVDSDEFAYALLADPGFDPRTSVILQEREDAQLPDDLAVTGDAQVTAFAPERIEITITGSTSPAVLSIALPHYPGWRAEIDGEAAALWRAYGGLSAVALPAGAQTVILTYQPITFTLGALISAAGWLSLSAVGVILWLRRRATGAQEVRDVQR